MSDTSPLAGDAFDYGEARQYVEIRPEFRVLTDFAVLEGVSLSLGGFRVRRRALILASERDEPIDEGHFRGVQYLSLRLKLSGFVLELPVEAQVQAATGRPAPDLAFRFVAMTPQNRAALHQMIRTYLTGTLTTVEELTRTRSPAPQPAPSVPLGTMPSVAAPPPPRPATPAPKPKRLPLSAVVLAVVLLALAATAAARALYLRFFVIEAEFAAVTAPRIDIRSAHEARVGVIHAPSDQTVIRGEPLFQLDSGTINAEVEAARARMTFIEALGAGEAVDPQKALSLTQATGDDTLGLSADLTPQEIGVALSYQAGLLRALALKQSELMAVSPCDCTVVWALEHGAWVQPGDRVVTLAQTGTEDLRVDALVPRAQAVRLLPGQRASVTVLASGQIIAAEVERVAPEGDAGARAGFPDWLEQDAAMATVRLKLLEMPADLTIGTQVSVSLRL